MIKAIFRSILCVGPFLSFKYVIGLTLKKNIFIPTSPVSTTPICTHHFPVENFPLPPLYTLKKNSEPSTPSSTASPPASPAPTTAQKSTPTYCDEPTLHIWTEKLHPEQKLSDERAHHEDLSGYIKPSDCFDFAARYWNLEGQPLLDKINEGLHLHLEEGYSTKLPEYY